jgi:hypothetical protein
MRAPWCSKLGMSLSFHGGENFAHANRPCGATKDALPG